MLLCLLLITSYLPFTLTTCESEKIYKQGDADSLYETQTLVIAPESHATLTEIKLSNKDIKCGIVVRSEKLKTLNLEDVKYIENYYGALIEFEVCPLLRSIRFAPDLSLGDREDNITFLITDETFSVKAKEECYGIKDTFLDVARSNQIEIKKNEYPHNLVVFGTPPRSQMDMKTKYSILALYTSLIFLHIFVCLLCKWVFNV